MHSPVQGFLLAIPSPHNAIKCFTRHRAAFPRGRIASWSVDAETVSRAVDFEPAVGSYFAFEDFIVNAIVEDLCAAAREGAEACVAEGRQHFSCVHPRDAGEVDDLDGGEGFDVQLRAGGADAFEHVEVVIKLEPRVQAANDVNFGGDGVGGTFLGRLDHLLEWHLVSALFAAFAVKATEFA